MFNSSFYAVEYQQKCEEIYHIFFLVLTMFDFLPNFLV